jgi:hypothetical protein
MALLQCMHCVWSMAGALLVSSCWGKYLPKACVKLMLLCLVILFLQVISNQFGSGWVWLGVSQADGSLVCSITVNEVSDYLTVGHQGELAPAYATFSCVYVRV